MPTIRRSKNSSLSVGLLALSAAECPYLTGISLLVGGGMMAEL
jgi:hypothetical protein